MSTFKDIAVKESAEIDGSLNIKRDSSYVDVDEELQYLKNQIWVSPLDCMDAKLGSNIQYGGVILYGRLAIYSICIGINDSVSWEMWTEIIVANIREGYRPIHNGVNGNVFNQAGDSFGIDVHGNGDIVLLRYGAPLNDRWVRGQICWLYR